MTQVDAEQILERLDAMQTQVDGVEMRVAQLEPIVAEIPALKAYMGRVERLVLIIQGELKSVQRHFDVHNKAVEAKLDALLALLQPRVVLGDDVVHSHQPPPSNSHR